MVFIAFFLLHVHVHMCSRRSRHPCALLLLTCITRTSRLLLLQQHDEAQRDGAHRDEPQRAARDRKDQARRRAHTYSCRYDYYYYYYSS